MKAYKELATGHGMALNAQTASDIEYYEGVDIYDAEGVLAERCRYFPVGDLGSPDPVPEGLQSFFAREFPTTPTSWTKIKRVEWGVAAVMEPPMTMSETEAEMDVAMLAWATAHNYPTGRE